MSGVRKISVHNSRTIPFLVAILLVLGSALFADIPGPGITRAANNPPVWGEKPLLENYLMSPDIADDLRREVGLSENEHQIVYDIAVQEGTQLHELEQESLVVIGRQDLTIEEKRKEIEHSAYNFRMREILKENQAALKEALGVDTYQRLVDWIENRWDVERERYGKTAEQNFSREVASGPQAPNYVRTFEIYATRYDAGGAYYVALPDKCLKFANGGALLCEGGGYAYGQNYSVAVTYEGKTIYATVGEAGPWNIDDNFWATVYDPQPRRMFSDLPLGIPEAQAAYFNGYNGGLDQFGRVVKSPVAIDISYAVAGDLGLPSGNNLVTVSFLWTEDWDGSQTNPEATPAPTALPVVRIEAATPNADGSIIHVVQQGQTLIGIATVYDVPIQELLALNNLTMDSIILPGDKILVKPADPTPTLTPIQIPPTATEPPTASPTATASLHETPSIDVQEPASTGEPGNDTTGVDTNTLLMIMAAVGLTGLALVVLGRLINRKE